MSSFPVPPDENKRLAILDHMGIIGSENEDVFDKFTRFATKLFGTSISAVTLIDKDKQFFKSTEGLKTKETPRDVSFCTHVIMSDETMVVEDALEDKRFEHNPFVKGEPNIRFYAGHPLRSLDNVNLGVFCIIDNKPHTFSEEDKKVLKDLALMVEGELRSREAKSKGRYDTGYFVTDDDNH